MKKLKIGVLRETKNPPDRRVALPPEPAAELIRKYPGIDLVVQPSELRCFADAEYDRQGIALQEDLSDCDLLIGVKEVKTDALLPGKDYLFFAHVAKEQPYNRNLLKTILNQRIRLIDYEYLTDSQGVRLIAFGRWAGIVGAYNGLRGLGMATGAFSLKPAHDCRDRAEMDDQLLTISLPDTRILVSGGGRVAKGAMETLSRLKIREVNPASYLREDFNEPVICRIDPEHYVSHRDGRDFDYSHFFQHPADYQSTALPYLMKTDLYIAAHYWDPRSPRMFELSDLDRLLETGQDRHTLRMIADISCDINGSVPVTTHATTIADPFYWYGNDQKLLMMTVDNLPGELPRDASMEFAGALSREIIPRIVEGDPDGVIERAMITENGELTAAFRYLNDYVSA